MKVNEEAAKYEAYEVSLVGEHEGNTCEVLFAEDDLRAVAEGRLPERCIRTFWSLYGWREGHGVQCIGDFDTKEHAYEVLALILGVAITVPEGTSASIRLDGTEWV